MILLCVQSIMRAALGYRPDDVDMQEVNELHDVFITWVRGLFALPINLPGCGVHLGRPTSCCAVHC
jgi:hypothetical protein